MQTPSGHLVLSLSPLKSGHLSNQNTLSVSPKVFIFGVPQSPSQSLGTGSHLELIYDGRDCREDLRLPGLGHVAAVVSEDGVQQGREEVVLHHAGVLGLADPARDQVQRLLLHHTHGGNQRLSRHKLTCSAEVEVGHVIAHRGSHDPRLTIDGYCIGYVLTEQLVDVQHVQVDLTQLEKEKDIHNVLGQWKMVDLPG